LAALARLGLAVRESILGRKSDLTEREALETIDLLDLRPLDWD
jgi:hypothetical protein